MNCQIHQLVNCNQKIKSVGDNDQKYKNMHRLINNFSLKKSNTFGINAIAKHYLSVDSSNDLIHFFNNNSEILLEKRLFLGAGSNLLFIHDYDGLVIHLEIGGIEVISENKYFVEVEVGAGVKWDYFVAWSVDQGWSGIENLSLIPGNIGAVPVQNIGAYGIEASSVISQVKGVDLDRLENKYFSREACEFGYRTSLFKEKLKESFVVTSVVFRLSKHPDFKIQYDGLQEKIAHYGEINLINIRQAIIAIRESKLPDPSKIGNAGSFFKNPLVTEAFAKRIRNLYPEIPLYPIGSGLVKVAAGWLIEKAGWKGKSFGEAAIHDTQSLVIINKGGATGSEIFRLSELVAEDVLQKFDIQLEREVQII